jgi:glyoxylase-like metal-dependent hydrolase (beta-lactamase superfamily II)
MIRGLLILAALPAISILGCSSETDTSPEPVEESAPGAAATPDGGADADAVLADVSAAMGAEDIDSITLTGTAWRIRNSFMQTPNASPPWPSRDEIANFRLTVDPSQPALLATGDTFAQNLFLEPAVAGMHTISVPADQTAWAQQLEIWLTPWGFLEGAQNNGVEASTASVEGTDYTVLTWMSPQRSPSEMQYTVNGYINDENLIERVETWVEHPFMGDFRVVQVYDDYQELNGLMVPTTIEQQRGGGGIFGVDVTGAEANPANLAALLTPPEGGPGGFGGGGTPQPVEVVEAGEGVHLITGGYVALVAEFEDHVLVFEGGQSEARGQTIVDEVKSLHPDKPIRYIVNSHPHSDHTAGLVPFIREGATLVTHANNVDFLTIALSTPRTLLGEETLNPTVEGVEGVGVYEDSTMRVELHPVPNLHTDGMLVAYLPEQGILFQADFTLPMEGAQANPFVVTLAEYVDQAGLDFERYLAVHAAQVPQTKAGLMAAIGQ